MALLKKYNSIKKIVNKLNNQIDHMQDALNHIECWTDEYQKKNNVKPNMPLDRSANNLHGDLYYGIQLVKKLIETTQEKK